MNVAGENDAGPSSVPKLATNTGSPLPTQNQSMFAAILQNLHGSLVPTVLGRSQLPLEPSGVLKLCFRLSERTQVWYYFLIIHLFHCCCNLGFGRLLPSSFLHFMRSMFFFLEFGRCRAKARSLHEHKLSKRRLYKDTVGPYEQANRRQKTKKHTRPPNHDDPQIPQPDLRFARERSKTAGKTTKTNKRGRSPNKTPTFFDLPRDTVV